MLTYPQFNLISLSSGQRLRGRRSSPPLPTPILSAPQPATLESTSARHAPNCNLLPPLQHLSRRCPLRSAFRWTERLRAFAVLFALRGGNRYLACGSSILGVLGCDIAQDRRI